MTAPISMSRLTEKRLIGEMRDLRKNKLDFAQAIQDEKNPFIFHFLLKGADDTDYAGGYYIGDIILPTNYPEKPGDFIMRTPNGRFSIGSKICLTNSGYHAESWTPMWTIRNMTIAFISIMMVDDTTGISHIKESPEERRFKARNSIAYNLTNYPELFKSFDQFVNEDGTVKTSAEVQASIDGDNKPKKKEKSQAKSSDKPNEKVEETLPATTDPSKSEPVQSSTPVKIEALVNVPIDDLVVERPKRGAKKKTVDTQTKDNDEKPKKRVTKKIADVVASADNVEKKPKKRTTKKDVK